MSKDFFLTVCAIAKNEANYIEEFIVYHQLMGVEHFFIYDNESTDATLQTLLKFPDELVTVIPWPKNPPQFEAYNHFLKSTWATQTEWCAFIDIDEFLVPKIDFSAPARKFLQTLPLSVSVFAPRWRLFGSNGLVSGSNDLVIERFTRRCAAPDKHVKSIVRTAKVSSVGNNPHVFRVIEGDIVDEKLNKLPKEYAILEPGPADLFCIHHYHTKSMAEYFERKLSKPDPGSGRNYSNKQVEEMFYAHDVNEVYDFSAAKWNEAVRDKLSQMPKIDYKEALEML